MLGTQELDTAGEVSQEQSRILSLALLAALLFMQPSIQLAFRAERACSRFISNYSATNMPKSCRAALSSQPLLMLLTAQIQVQLCAVELHEVHIVSALNPVKVPLNGNPSLQHIICTTRLSVICKLAENTLNALFMSLIKTQPYQCQYRFLRDTTWYRSPLDTEALITNPWMQSSSQFLILLVVHQ